MPLALFLAAIMFGIIAVRGNYAEAGNLFNKTFFGAGSGSGFLKWFGSMVAIAVIFRIIQAPKAGELFLTLLLIVYFLQNQGVIQAIEGAIQGQGVN